MAAIAVKRSVEAERLERFCSAARISARSDKSGEALRATRRSVARSATERAAQGRRTFMRRPLEQQGGTPGMGVNLWGESPLPLDSGDTVNAAVA